MDSVVYYSVVVAMARVLKTSGAWDALLDAVELESELRKIRIERIKQDGQQSGTEVD